MVFIDSAAEELATAEQRLKELQKQASDVNDLADDGKL